MIFPYSCQHSVHIAMITSEVLYLMKLFLGRVGRVFKELVLNAVIQFWPLQIYATEGF